MTTKSVLTLAARVLGALLSLICPAWAHDFWAVKLDDGFVVMRGHIPDEFHEYDPECVKTLSAYDRQGIPIPLERVNRQHRVEFRVRSDPACVAAVAKWGYRVIDGNGRKRFLSKAQAIESGIDVKEAFFSTQHSKTLFHFHEKLAKPLGMKLEVVPQKNPLTLQVGDVFPVQVLFDGAPLPKGKIDRGRRSAPLETDARGMAQIPIVERGWQKVLVIHDLPTPEKPDIDYERFFAFLVFELK